jgi:hypothetical protein
MADTDYSFVLEMIDTESPGDTIVAPGATEATLFFLVDGNAIYQTFLLILGFTTVSNVNNQGRPQFGFDRQLPMSHPRYPYLYAESIDIVGISNVGKTISATLNYPNFIFDNPSAAIKIDYKTFPYFERPKQYRVAVKFTSRNYFLLTNDQLLPTINDPAGGIPRNYTYWKKDYLRANGVKDANYTDTREYLRYTEIIGYNPGNEIIANSTGKGFWKSRDLNGQVPTNGPQQDSVITIENASVNFQTIAKNEFKVKWYQIPKWIFQPSDSDEQRPWDYASGMVNYGANYNEDPGNIDVFNFNLFGFSPGTILYTGYTLENASNAFPTVYLDGAETYLKTNYLYNQYYNVEFNFIQWAIPPDVLLKPNLALIDTKEGKMYSNGWNFTPNGNRNFYYIENGPSTRASNMPPYFSFPAQAIFAPREIIAP